MLEERKKNVVQHENKFFFDTTFKCCNVCCIMLCLARPLFSADPTIVLKFFKMFVLITKSWKNHPQKLLRIPQIYFFPLLPWLPKWPKQKNSCFKMWPIDQLYNVYRNGLKTNTFLSKICSVFNPHFFYG